MAWFMDADGYLPFVVSLLVVPLARPLSDRLPPRAATWLLTALSGLTALATTLTLLALAAGGLVQLTRFADLTGLPVALLRAGAQTSPLVAALATVALVVALTACAVAAVRLRRAGRAARAAFAHLPDDGMVAILDDPAPDAFALPGRPGRVVVSTGMLALLDEAGEKVLLAHEAAHLTGRHHVFRAVTRLAAALNPLLRPVVRAVDYSTERQADEQAATALGDRARAARVLGRIALSRGTPPATLGIGDRTGPLPRRVLALLGAPPRHRVTLPVTVAAFVLTALWGPYDLALDLRDLLLGASAGERNPC
ncbi:M56 family metallopeptidase [Herbidospora sp. RD11066]